MQIIFEALGAAGVIFAIGFIRGNVQLEKKKPPGRR